MTAFYLLTRAWVYEEAHKLLKKENPTEREKEIIAAYKRIMRISPIVVCLCFLFLAVVIFFFFPFTSYAGKRYGTVQSDGQIRYVMGGEHYASAAELQLDSAALSTGDRIVLFYDKDDQLINAYALSAYNQQMNEKLLIILVVAVSVVLFLVLYAAVFCPKTDFGRAWYEFIREMEKKRMDKTDA